MDGWQTVADEDGPFDASRQITIPKTPSGQLDESYRLRRH